MPKSCTDTDNRPLDAADLVLAREVMERLTGKWAFWILGVLGEANRPMRFARVLSAVDGISQKMLTRTLRQLECDGFVSRRIFAEVPPRVEYELTDMGRNLLLQITPMFSWLISEIDAVGSARSRFAAATA